MPPELVCFREGDRAGRLVLLSGFGPDVSQLRPLADKIGGRGGVYVLDLFRLAADNDDALTIEALARHGCSALEVAGGADALVGYSFGGLVAYEMVRSMRAAGKSTEIVMIDVLPAEAHWPQRLWLASMSGRVLQHVRAILSLPVGEALAEFGHRVNGLFRRLRGRRVTAVATPASCRQTVDQRLAAAHHRYKPPPLTGRAILLESSKPMYAASVSSIWRPLIPELRILRFSGDHLDAVRSETSASAIAAHLNACLSAVASHGPPP